MTFLAIDVGNTRLKWAQYADTSPHARLICQGVEFLENIQSLSEGSWSRIVPPSSMLGCIVAGDAVRRIVEEQMEIWSVQPRWIVPQVEEAGVVNGYDHPSRLGADRWVAMIGARNRLMHLHPQPPIVIAMVGTAVTVDALDQTGRFLGGLILPGHGIMLKALERGTAGLNVPTGNVEIFPTNTSDALTSGGTYAIAGAVERMTEHVKHRCAQDPVCVMGGGAAWKMAPSMVRPVQLIDSLIFDGIRAIAIFRRM